jgi:opacity protein-like surface antigen
MHMRLMPVFAALFFSAAIPLLSQAVPTATDSESPFSVGGGLSGFNPDFDHGRNYGGTLWADYRLKKTPWYLQGVGFEVEARDIMLGHSSSQPSNLAETTIGGGVTYTWRHFRNFRPYGKILWEYGNADFKTDTGSDYSQSRTTTALGGGLDYHLYGKFWLRGDYEYQRWPDFFKHSNTSAGVLNPQGFTFGVTYHFGHKQPAE